MIRIIHWASDWHNNTVKHMEAPLTQWRDPMACSRSFLENHHPRNCTFTKLSELELPSYLSRNFVQNENLG